MSALINQARAVSQTVEDRRQAMLSAAFRRQETILSLKAAGLSVRKIADVLDVSTSVVQVQLQNAADRRPKTTRRDERVPYELHVSVLLKFEEAPQQVRAVALDNLAQMETTPRAPLAQFWLRKWKKLLNGPIDQLRNAMLADTELAHAHSMVMTKNPWQPSSTLASANSRPFTGPMSATFKRIC